MNDNVMEVVIGRFGVPNRNGDVFIMPKSELSKALDRMVGKVIGEQGQRHLRDGIDPLSVFRRVSKIDPTNSAGTLLDYSIRDTELGYDVIGKIDLHPSIVDDVTIGPVFGSFGIRAFVKPGNGSVKHVEQLICFDYLPLIQRESPVDPVKGN